MIKLGVILTVVTAVLCDDKKWVWGDNSRNSGKNIDRLSDFARYEVNENDRYEDRPSGGNRPLGDQPFVPFPERPINNRPFIDGPINNRPFFERPIGNEGPIGPRPGGPGGPGGPGRPDLFIPNERPGGVYGNGPLEGNYGPGYGNGNTYHPEDGILTGPIPSWIKQGPIKNFDRCKCAEKFNCNSPGISYGHCDVGKQYCCYSIKKSSQIGGPIPNRPINSPELGVLTGPGPGRPHIPPPPINRPYGRPIDEPYSPPNLGRPVGNFGPNRQRPGGNIHSLQNGVLVGPGGPFDRPYGGFGGFGRSAKKD